VDNDGDVDLLVTNNGGAPELLRNGTGGGNAMVLRLIGVASNRDALGARVSVTAVGRTQVREVKSGSSYLGQNDLRVHVGLGAAASVERVEIRLARWPARTARNAAAEPYRDGSGRARASPHRCPLYGVHLELRGQVAYTVQRWT
jgi:hypothetical protein